jgi:hypothetical protein
VEITLPGLLAAFGDGLPKANAGIMCSEKTYSLLIVSGWEDGLISSSRGYSTIGPTRKICLAMMAKGRAPNLVQWKIFAMPRQMR